MAIRDEIGSETKTKRDGDETEMEMKSRQPNEYEAGNQLWSTVDRPTMMKMVDDYGHDGDRSTYNGVWLEVECERI